MDGSDMSRGRRAFIVTVAIIQMIPAVAVLAIFLVDLVDLVGLLVLVCWGLVAFCAWHRHRVRRRAASAHPRGRPAFTENLSHFGLLYLVPISVAMTAHLCLSLYVSRAGDSLGIERLIALQRSFEAVSAFFTEHLKLSEVKVLAVLAAVHLLTCLLLSGRVGGRRPGRRRWAAALHRVTDVYTRYSGPAAAGLATLAAFTFFGMQLGEPAKELRLRVKVAQKGYAEIAEKVESRFSRRVVAELYEEVRGSFPPSYRRALADPTAVADLAERVRERAERARSRHGVRVPAAEAAVRKAAAGAGDREVPETHLRVESTDRHRPPADVTPEQVSAARDTLPHDGEGGAIDLVADGRKKATLQIEKVVSERIVALTKPLTEAVPLLEPLMQAFVEAADKTLQDRMGEAYDRLMRTAVREPRQLDTAIAREARAVVEGADVGPAVERATGRALVLVEERQRALAVLKRSQARIDERVDRHLAAREAREKARAARQRPVLPPLEHLLSPKGLMLPELYSPDLYLRLRLRSLHNPPSWHYTVPGREPYAQSPPWATRPKPVLPKPQPPRVPLVRVR